MTLLSWLAALLAMLLMAFGVNLSELSGDVQGGTPAVATQAPQVAPSDAAQAPGATEQALAPTDAAQGAVDWLDQDAVLADAQSLVTALYGGMMGESYTAPAFVADTAGTRLAARWVDYMRVRMARSEETQLKSFNRPGVVPTLNSIQAVAGAEPERVRAEVACKLSLNTVTGGEYTKNLTLRMTYERTSDGTEKVVEIDIDGDAAYDTLGIVTSGHTTIDEIDAAVDSAIASLS